MEVNCNQKLFILSLFEKYLSRDPLPEELLFHENEVINLKKTLEEKDTEFSFCEERYSNLMNIILSNYNIEQSTLSYFDICFLKFIINKYNFDLDQIILYFSTYNIKNKIALLLSGHSRNFDKFYENTKKFFLNDINPDIFIHTWNNVGFQSKENHKHGSSWITKNDSEVNTRKIIKMFSPKDIVVENFKQNLDSFKFNSDKEIFYFDGQAKDDASKYINSQLYSIYKSNFLKALFETKNNIKYDIVIRMRFDFCIEKKININDLCESLFKIRENNNLFFIAHPTNTKHGHPGGGGGCKKCISMYEERNIFAHKHTNDICDIIVISSSANMDFYSSLYLEAKKIYDKNSIYNLVNIKKHNVKYNKVKNVYYILEFGPAIEEYTFCYYPEKLIRKHLENFLLLNDQIFYGEISRCRL